MDELKPMLLTCLKGYNKEKFVKDVIAGIIVAIIALPLSIALALASGVGPEEGLYTAIVAGFLISLFGGSSVQIAGPTAAFATIVARVVMEFGMEGLILATLMAGILLILMGLFKFGSLIKFIPYTITTGFTAGIAVTIIVGQLKDFFGLTYGAGVSPVETMEKIEAVIEHFGSINIMAVVVGLISLAILIFWPKVSKKIPGSLVAIVVSVLLVKLGSLSVNTIGDLYEVSSALPSFHLPSLDLGLAKAVLPDAFTIAILAAIESLLSCVVADGMTNTKHRSNMELVAQGIGNVGSCLFGGIPATGAIARTAANINNGGSTPISGMVHAIVLLIILVVLMPYAAWIPMPTIAAILFTVAYNMCQWKPFVKLVKTAPKSDVLVLVLTFVLTIVFDLVVAIGVGIVLACILFMKRMSDETKVSGWSYVEEEYDDSNKLMNLHQAIRVYEISGPLFFGASDQISRIGVKDYTKVLVIRMRAVPAIDVTAMNALENLYESCNKAGITLVLSHVNKQPYDAMKKAGLIKKIGKENICDHIEDAISLANKYIKD